MSKISGLSLCALLLASLPIAAQSQPVSVSPASGSGHSQTFTITATEPAGATSIDWTILMINSVFDGETGCWISYNNVVKAAYLNIGGSEWVAIPDGLSLENSRCSVRLTSASESGNNLQLSFDISFRSGAVGAQKMWAAMFSQSEKGEYRQIGEWTAPPPAAVPDFSYTLGPDFLTLTAGQSVTLNFSAGTLNGYSGIVSISALPLGNPDGVTVTTPAPFDVSMNHPVFGGVTIHTSTSTPHIDNLTIYFTFSDGSIQHTAPVKVFINAASGPPAPTVSARYTTLAGPSSMFIVTATDPSGYAAINSVNLLINTAVDGRNACWLNYSPIAGTGGGVLSLASDDASDWSASMPISDTNNFPAIIQNTQCFTGGAGPVTVSASGNTITLSIALTLTPGFRGTKDIYARASNIQGGDSGYRQQGQITLAGGTAPDFVIGLAPGPQTVTGADTATWTLSITGHDGYHGVPSVSIAGLPPNSTLTPPAVIGEGQSTTFSVTTTDDTPAGSYPLTVTAVDGLASHSARVTLNVQNEGIPEVDASPISGSGPSYNLSFTASSPAGSPEPAGMTILINSSVDGRHACWLHFDGQTTLASDDGLAWAQASNGQSQNSQCGIFNVVDASAGSTLAFEVNPWGETRS
jgi:hypothetical protein